MPDIFGCFRLIVFVSAAAVAVRAVAPCLKNKAEDPGVVVVDEQGRFAVSLLSGHLGGANEEARNIAGHINACAVITTATDGRGLPAFDDLARRWGWGIENLPELKGISAALLEGREVVLYSELPFNRELPGPVRVTAEPGLLRAAEHGFVVVSSREKTPPGPPGLTGLVLRPRNISAGVGCRRGVSAERIINAVRSAFREAGLAAESLCCLATGEFKAAEPGLVAAAGRLGVPLKVFTGEEIRGALGNSVQSNFVEEQVGVGAVAEPCARLGSGGGKIVLPTLRAGGITVALAEGSLFPSG